jgi:hypothetical protein
MRRTLMVRDGENSLNRRTRPAQHVAHIFRGTLAERSHDPIRLGWSEPQLEWEESLKNRPILFVTIYVVAAAIGVVIVWLTMGSAIFEPFDVFHQLFRYISFHKR